MNEGYLKLISTRLHSLEVNVTKMQEIIRRNKLAVFEKEEIYFRNENEGLFTDKAFGNEIKLIDVEEEANGHDKNAVKRRFSGILKIGQQASEMSTPTCLLKTKQSLMYYIMWAVMYVFSISVSYYYIKTQYDNWQSSPVVQAISNNQVHLENISFPAITICWPPKFKSDYDLIKNVERCMDCQKHVCKLKNETCDYIEMTTLAFAYTMCVKYGLANPLPPEMWKNRYINQAIDTEEFSKYMTKLLPSCEVDSVVMTKSYVVDGFKKYTRCNGTVFQQFYGRGSNHICITYNSLRHKDIFEDYVVPTLPLSKENDAVGSENPMWSFDNMMEFNGSFDTVPSYGIDGFIVLFDRQEKNDDQMCKLVDDNIASVMIHSPNEIPYITDSVDEFPVRDNNGIDILLVPKITLARADLAQYSPQQRGCFFTHEKKLTMFKFYTKNHCDLECLVNAYVDSCGCVPFLYPRPNDSIPVCVMFCQQPKYECECLPDCNSLSYEVTTQESAVSGLVLANVSVLGLLELKFKGKKYYTNVRYSITSHAEFLAYSFGVLGAFLGFSVPCLCQLFYSGLLRLWNNFVRTAWKNKTSPLHQT